LRPHSSRSPDEASGLDHAVKQGKRTDWRVVGDLLPYLLAYKARVVLAIACLIAAKFANLGIPVLLKQLIDALDVRNNVSGALLVVPVGIITGYGLLRFSASLFSELREALFSRVTQHAVRQIALDFFNIYMPYH